MWMGTFALPSVVKQKACKSALQATLIGRAKWGAVRWPEPTQCGAEAGVLVGTILSAIVLYGVDPVPHTKSL